MNRFPLVVLMLAGGVAWGQNAAPTAVPAATPTATPAKGTPAAQSKIQKWLATMDAQWQPIFAREVTGPFDAEMARLRQQYLTIIDANIAKATCAGNLDLTLLWRKERERMVAAKELPPADEAADAAVLKAARAPIRTQAERLEKERATRAKGVHGRYDQELAQTQSQLTQQQRIDDALAVKTRREEIAKAWLGEAGAAAAQAENQTRVGQSIAAGSSPQPHTISSSKANEEFFVGKTWVSPAGTEFTFDPAGAGHSQFGGNRTPIQWHHLGSGIVEVLGKTKADTRYFKFISATEAYYNGDKKDITKPVHLK